MQHPILERLKAVPAQWNARAPARPGEFAELEEKYGLSFPEEYRELMVASNGGGVASSDHHQSLLYLDSIEDVLNFRWDEVFIEGLPGMVVIGGDGGGNVYYYDPRNQLEYGEWAVFLVEQGAASFEWSWFVAESLGRAIERVLNGDRLYDGFMLGSVRRSTESPLVTRLRKLSRPACGPGAPGDREDLEKLERRFSLALPAEYRELALLSNGFTLNVGDSTFQLESIRGLLLSLEHEPRPELPDMFMIGSDLEGSIYYYDPKGRLGQGKWSVFIVPREKPSFEASRLVGKSLTEVIENFLNKSRD